MKLTITRPRGIADVEIICQIDTENGELHNRALINRSLVDMYFSDENFRYNYDELVSAGKTVLMYEPLIPDDDAPYGFGTTLSATNVTMDAVFGRIMEARGGINMKEAVSSAANNNL